MKEEMTCCDSDRGNINFKEVFPINNVYQSCISRNGRHIDPCGRDSIDDSNASAVFMRGERNEISNEE